MARTISSEKLTLFTYFISIIAIGTILLRMPAAWDGTEGLKFIDALFTSVSAVCVTGLITVDTALYSAFGKWVILALIQAGGLGIISFTTLYLAIPRGKISLRSVRLIKTSYIDAVEHKAEHIIRNIIVTTIILELIGTLFLYIGFKEVQEKNRFFISLFHSISAFCNAGFSLFTENLTGYHTNPMAAYSVIGLIILGGLGFVVVQDVGKRIAYGKKLTFHSKIVLSVTGFLIAGGAFLYFVFERNNTLAGVFGFDKLTAVLFQSVTTRTAGFNTVVQSQLTQPSQFITLPLMFTGGSPGSIAGGVKVTTVFIVFLTIFRSPDKEGNFRIGSKKIMRQTVTNANIFIMKALTILILSSFALILGEFLTGNERPVLPLLFESFSAFGTVGLSLGITPELTVFGKCAIIFTMFAGRVGLISMALPKLRKWEHAVDFPKGEVLIG